MLKLHPKKIITLLGVILFFSIGLLALNLNNPLTATRGELEKLYETSFTNCTVTKLEERKYPGRGNYLVFYTNCSSDAFPLLLDRAGNANHYKLIKENVTLTKEAQSTTLTVTDDTQKHAVTLRHPENEDSRPLDTRIGLILIGVMSVIIMIIPNSMFDRKS